MTETTLNDRLLREALDQLVQRGKPLITWEMCSRNWDVYTDEWIRLCNSRLAVFIPRILDGLAWNADKIAVFALTVLTVDVVIWLKDVDVRTNTIVFEAIPK